MGLLDLIKFNQWKISAIDPEVRLELEAQFDPEQGMERSLSPQLGTAVSAGSSLPHVQAVSGGLDVVRFDDVFRAQLSITDIRPQIDTLERLARVDPSIGRIPRIQLTWGDLEITGFVSALTTRITDYWWTGLPKACAFTIEITRAEELGLETGPAGETLYVVLGSGETFEELGRRYYGDPLLGELIRRQNPSLADGEAAGDLVKVLEANHPAVAGVRVAPTSIPLLDGGGWDAIVEGLCESRGQVGQSGQPWSTLPEVLSGEVEDGL